MTVDTAVAIIKCMLNDERGVAVRARSLLVGGTFDPTTLAIVREAFDMAWSQVAPGVGSNPEAIEAAQMKLANTILQATKSLEEYDATGLADIVLQLMYAEPTELD